MSSKGKWLSAIVTIFWWLGGSINRAGAADPVAPGLNAGFRVMTYNIHHGEGMDKRVDLPRIAHLILREKADLVALQEIDQGVQRTKKQDFPEELAKLTGMACVFSNNFHFQGGDYGNAILTRHPVRQWTNTHIRMLRPGEQRGILQVVVEIDQKPLLFISTHLDFRADDTERLAHVEQLKACVKKFAGMPVLIAGDFNDRPGSRTCQAMGKEFDDAWLLAGSGEGFTIPSGHPNQRIDYVWILKNSPVKPVRASIPASDASDHLPVVVEMAWPSLTSKP